MTAIAASFASRVGQNVGIFMTCQFSQCAHSKTAPTATEIIVFNFIEAKEDIQKDHTVSYLTDYKLNCQTLLAIACMADRVVKTDWCTGTLTRFSSPSTSLLSTRRGVLTGEVGIPIGGGDQYQADIVVGDGEEGGAEGATRLVSS